MEIKISKSNVDRKILFSKFYFLQKHYELSTFICCGKYMGHSFKEICTQITLFSGSNDPCPIKLYLK